MFDTDIPMARIKYYIISEDADMFIRVDEDTDTFSLIGEIENASSWYNKETALKYCNIFNLHPIDVMLKVVCIRIEYSMWNRNVEKSEC